jgi:hypothetical protein
VDKLAPVAVQALVDVLQDPDTKPRDKIKAAEAILDRGHLHKRSSTEVTGTIHVDPAEIIQEVWSRHEARLAQAVEDQRGEAAVIDVTPVAECEAATQDRAAFTPTISSPFAPLPISEHALDLEPVPE